MTLINLEDVQKILENNIWSHDWIHDSIWISVIEKINSLPTHDPIAVLKEMIEELEWLQPEWWKLAKKDILEEVISRITKNNSLWQNQQ